MQVFLMAWSWRLKRKKNNPEICRAGLPGSMKITKISALILCNFPKFFYGVDFLSDKDYDENIRNVHVHGHDGRQMTGKAADFS